MKKVELRVKETCEKRNIKQSDLARKTELRKNAISVLFKGEDIQRVSIHHLEKIANALELEDINELITLVEVKDK